MRIPINADCAATLIVLMLVALTPDPAQAQEQHAHSMPDPKSAMLLEGMGDVHHPITTSNPEAQKFFDQGLALIYGFNREEAVRSFRRAAELDPKAAMPYWGMALGVGPHINMDVDSDVQPAAGYESIQKALSLESATSAGERALIEALAKRFSADPKADERNLSIAYRKAMSEVARNYPDDLDAATLYAESIMCLSRWDYYNNNGSAKDGTDELVAVLETVLRRDPYHLGANHYYIHAVEASPNPERALPSAARLMGLAPAAGHLVHMPGHIFLRTGDFSQTVFTNVRAVQADKDYVKQTNAAPGVYTMGYASHNIHFIVVGAAMQGRFAEAKKAADELAAYIAPGIDVMPPMVDYFGVNPLLVLYRFNRWDDILKLSEPSSKLQMTTVLWRFARCVALASKGKLSEAREEQRAFEAVLAKVPADYQIGFSSVQTVMRVAKSIIEAKLAGDDRTAVEHWKRAVAAQDALRYNEPPDWFYPVRESLGSALLRAGRASEAEAVFREDLKQNPRNGRSLFGLMKSLEAQKKSSDADWVRREFERAWKFADVQLRVEDL